MYGAVPDDEQADERLLGVHVEPAKPTYKRATAVVVALALASGAAVVASSTRASPAKPTKLDAAGGCPDFCVKGFVDDGGCGVIMTGDMTLIAPLVPPGCEDAGDACAPAAFAACGVAGPPPMADGFYGGMNDGTYGAPPPMGPMPGDYYMPMPPPGPPPMNDGYYMNPPMPPTAYAPPPPMPDGTDYAAASGPCPSDCVPTFVAIGGCKAIETGDFDPIMDQIPMYCVSCDACGPPAMAACGMSGMIPDDAPTYYAPPPPMPPMDGGYYMPPTDYGGACPSYCVPDFVSAGGCMALVTGDFSKIEPLIPSGCKDASGCKDEAMMACGMNGPPPPAPGDGYYYGAPPPMPPMDGYYGAPPPMPPMDGYYGYPPPPMDGYYGYPPPPMDGFYGSAPGTDDSCAGNCGGSAGTCWCDSYCTGYGDCCADFTMDCPTIAGDTTGPNDDMDEPDVDGSCAGNCGGYGGSCWCDSYCTGYGDCCADFTMDCPDIANPPPTTDYGSAYGYMPTGAYGDYTYSSYPPADNFYGPAAGADDSCAGNCGGSAGTCWCDSYCSTYGDCCADFTMDCPDVFYAKKSIAVKNVATTKRPTKMTESKQAIDVWARKKENVKKFEWGKSLGKKAVAKKQAVKKQVAKKQVRPTKALSKKPIDIKARKAAKTIAETKRTRQSKALSKRPVDVDARKFWAQQKKASAAKKLSAPPAKKAAVRPHPGVQQKAAVQPKAAVKKAAVRSRGVQQKAVAATPAKTTKKAVATPAKTTTLTTKQMTAVDKAFSSPAKTAAKTTTLTAKQLTAVKKAFSSPATKAKTAAKTTTLTPKQKAAMDKAWSKKPALRA